MPHKLQNENMYEVRGVYANQELLVLITKMIGREVLLETRDGLVFEGIFAGCSPDFDVGLRYAHEVFRDDKKNLLPHKDQIIEKLQIERDCVYSMGAKYRDEKQMNGFATDREYANQSGTVVDTELQVWESEEGFDNDLVLNDDQEDGWSVEQMFQANDVLGVKSTFDENMPEYATADMQGDAEDFKRAERIAQEINSTSASRARAQLENDDEERDLDTSECHMHHISRKTGRGSYSGNARDRGCMNTNRGPPNGRRSEGMPGSGRGRGPYGSGGGSSRLFTNSSMGHGVRPQNSVGSGPTSRYAPSGILERPTAQELHLQFGQWVRRGESSGASSATDSTRGGRRSEQIGSNARVYDHRLVTNQHEGQPPREENKNLHYSSTPSGIGGGSRQQASKQTERVRNLKEFHQNFNSSFQPSNSVRNGADDVQRSNTMQGTATSGIAPRPVNNAWNKGPPPGMRATSSSTQIAPNRHPEISPAKEMETSASAVSAATSCPPDHRSQQAVVKARGSIQSTATGHSVTAPSDVALKAASDCHPNKPTTSAISGSGVASSKIEVAGVIVLDTQTSTATVASREIQQTHQLSAAISSSSIAPTDPTPSATVADTTKTTAPNPVTSTYDGKHFVWNPDAPSFVPRSLTNSRSIEQQSHRPALHNGRTPHSAPLPLMSTHIAAPGQMQGLALANPQALSVQNVPSIAHAGPPQMFPYAHANPYGTAMPVYYNTPIVQATPCTATATAAATANVTGGPIVASTTGLPIGRHGQIAGQTPSSNRRNQQQQFMQSVAGMFVPGTSQPYAQQLMSQCQMPYFAPYPSQLAIGASSNIPPPPIPPPSTNAVLTAPPPYQIIQTQAQQPNGFPRQLYQGDHSVNYMISRLPHSHPAVDYAATAVSTQQQPQQGSSVASSNGTGSNGPNSQPATPVPVVSPAQVRQQQTASISHYPQSGTPQSPHTLLVPLPPGVTPPNAQPHMYVQAPQFPFITSGQPGFVMAYGPQPVVVHPSVATPTAHVPFSQAHQPHAQPGVFEQFQGAAIESTTLQQPQISSNLPHQPYIPGDQIYGHCMHLQQQQGVFQQQQQQLSSQQQQAGSVGSVRHSSVSNESSGPSHQHQPFHPSSATKSSSIPPSDSNN